MTKKSKARAKKRKATPPKKAKAAPKTGKSAATKGKPSLPFQYQDANGDFVRLPELTAAKIKAIEEGTDPSREAVRAELRALDVEFSTVSEEEVVEVLEAEAPIAATANELMSRFVGNIESEDSGPLLDFLEIECVAVVEALLPKVEIPENRRPTARWRGNVLHTVWGSDPEDLSELEKQTLLRVLRQSECAANARQRLAAGDAGAAFWMSFAVWFHFEANADEVHADFDRRDQERRQKGGRRKRRTPEQDEEWLVDFERRQKAKPQWVGVQYTAIGKACKPELKRRTIQKGVNRAKNKRKEAQA